MMVGSQLVGRDRELRLLEESLEECLGGRGALIVIAGEAGIGKSRLIEEFGKLATRRGVRVIVGRCVPGTQAPYLPFQDALSFQREVHGRELGLRTWLVGPPDFQSTVDSQKFTLDPESESGRTMYAALDFFRKISEKKPLMVLLEDVHWADSASIRLLHLLARNSRDTRNLFIASYRPEDLVSESEGKPHPLLESLRIMRREGIVHEIELDRLNLDELRSVVEGLLGGPAEAELFEKVYRESGGNPLFAVEITRLLVQTKSIALRNNRWKTVGQIGAELPPTIREVVLRRVERLQNEQRRLLECASVIGERFDPEILGKALETTKLDVLETLDIIERESQLISALESVYRFSHEKVRQAIYDHVSRPRRKELHRIIGEILEKNPAREGLQSQISVHFYNSGDATKCVKYSLSAGQESLARFALQEALSHFGRVLELVKDNPLLLEQRLQALEGTGDCLQKLVIDDLGRSNYEALAELCKTPKEKARVFRKLAFSVFGAYEFPRATEILDLAENQGEIDVIEAGRVKSLRGYIAWNTGLTTEASKYAQAAEEIFRKNGALQELADTLIQESEILLSTGHIHEALEKTEEALGIYSRIQNPLGEFGAAFHLGDLYFHMGRSEEALESYAKAKQVGSRLGLQKMQRLRLFQALVYISIDDVDSAMREVVSGLEMASETQSSFYIAAHKALLALCQVHRGRLEEAERNLREASEASNNVTTAERTPLRSYMASVQGEWHAARKEWDLCNERFKEAIELFRPMAFGTLFEAIARARFGVVLAKQGRAAAAREQYDMATALYQALGNTAQIERITKVASAV